MPEQPFWRPPFGAAEDRNGAVLAATLGLVGWRPPFGAAEDRNLPHGEGRNGKTTLLAAALRGGRGSQQPLVPITSLHGNVWRPPFGAAEDRNG